MALKDRDPPRSDPIINTLTLANVLGFLKLVVASLTAEHHSTLRKKKSNDRNMASA